MIKDHVTVIGYVELKGYQIVIDDLPGRYSGTDSDRWPPIAWKAPTDKSMVDVGHLSATITIADCDIVKI